MNHPESTDDQLMRAHVRGDSQAFGQLIQRHQDRLWTLAVRIMRDPDDAADALQDAMISAFRRARSFRGDAAVATWLHRIVVNACLDRLRRLRSSRAEPLPENLERARALVATTELPETAAIRASIRVEVKDALATISADQRAALVLVDMEGYSMDEAAQLLGCAPGTVKSRCSRGRTRLAKILWHLQEGGE